MGSKKCFWKGILINNIKEYSVPLKITGLRTFRKRAGMGRGMSQCYTWFYSILIKPWCLLFPVRLELGDDKDNDNMKV